MTASVRQDFTVELACWQHGRDAIERVRRAVFIEEQRIPEHEEWDDVDPVATHVLAYVISATAKRDLVGTGRLEPTGKIGRVAVLPQYRGAGAGLAIMRRLVDLALERGFTEVYLNAQTSARGFYERLGFRADGPEFDEVGIPHQRMRRAVGNRDGTSAGHDGDTQPPVEP
ncbi:MAG TPA: GNAT family N-acetyltransferase [Steroidobacteraceae bacterium]|nr:GNAT family N-acetyltransferase [Steroidobacteraceae bacterium]